MLTQSIALHADHHDLVFENRHKSYGAYQLRKTYDSRLAVALMAPAGLFILLFSYFLFKSPPLYFLPCPPDSGICTLTADPYIRVIANSNFSQVVNKDLPPIVTEKQDETKPAEKPEEPSLPTFPGTNGPGTSGTGGFASGPGELTIPRDSAVISPVYAVDKIFDVADVMPTFDGYNEYMARHLKYPGGAIDNHVEGIVVISFEVGKDGKLSNFQTLKALPMGCTEAALEALKNMPPWQPGEVNHHTVRVKNTAVVRFQLKR